MSKNPVSRVKQLQTGQAERLKLICSFMFNEAREVELLAHKEFESYRIGGEWFHSNCANQVVNFLCEECKSQSFYQGNQMYEKPIGPEAPPCPESADATEEELDEFFRDMKEILGE